jgi:uncharacterized protein (TIGR02147 family)
VIGGIVTFFETRKKIELTSYSDYRSYLGDLFQVLKETFGKYSYTRFAGDLGLGASNIMFSIIKGRRKLMFKHVRVISEALGFDRKESRFFASLVRVHNSKKVGEHIADLDMLFDVAESRFENSVESESMKIMSAWQNVLVFEALDLFPSGAELGELTRSFKVRISKTEVRESLKLLIEMGYVREEAGLFCKAQRNFSTGSRVPGYGVIRYHLKMMELAQDCLGQGFRPDERNVSSVTLSVSDPTAELLLRELDDFRRRLVFLAQQKSQEDAQNGIPLQKLIQVNFQAFPLIDRQSKGQK